MKRLHVLLPGLLLLAACEPQPQAAELMVQELPTPAATESLAPQLFAFADILSLSWLEASAEGHALRYSLWQDGGWSEPRLVASGGDWFVNWADMPGVMPAGDGNWLAWWLQKSGADPYAYDIQLALSEDGDTWREIGTPHADSTPTEHGFVSAFALPGGRLGLAWLDGRNTASSGHEHHGGAMTLRHGEIDGDTVREQELDARVCDCCQTDAAWANDALVLVYRDRDENEVRDIRARRFANGEWEESVLVHADGWRIPGCPVNGPAVAADGDFVAVAWFTAAEGKPQVRLALSRDGGRSFAAPLRLDDGAPEGRVDVLVHPRHGVLASWLEKTGEGAEVRLRKVSRDGNPGGSLRLVASSAERASGFPRLGLAPDGRLLMAWTDTAGGRQVRTAAITLD